MTWTATITGDVSHLDADAAAAAEQQARDVLAAAVEQLLDGDHLDVHADFQGTAIPPADLTAGVPPDPAPPAERPADSDQGDASAPQLSGNPDDWPQSAPPPDQSALPEQVTAPDPTPDAPA